MRNSTGGTSTSAKKSQNNALRSAEKNSAKKLVQARLPFKVIAPGSPSVDEGPTSTGKSGTILEGKSTRSDGSREQKDTRKRKLSYDSDVDTEVNEETSKLSKENVEGLVATSKKKKIAATNGKVEEVIELMDDDDDDDKAVSGANNNTVINSSDDGNLKTKATVKKTPQAPVVREKRKGAGTPKSATSKAQKDKGGSASKLTIKLPISVGKKSKRRKSKVSSFLANSSNNDVSHENISCEDSSDDVEEITSEINPQKRSKLDFEENENDTEASVSQKVETSTRKYASGENGDINSEVESPSINPQMSETESITNTQETEKDKDKISPKCKVTTRSRKNEKNNITVPPVSMGKQDEEKLSEQNESIIIESDDSDVEQDLAANVDADDERENTNSKQTDVTNDADDKNKLNNTVESNITSDSDKHKVMTPKQKKLMERRQILRQEKERKLLDEKKKKQQEKEEKELAKRREREEKDDQKRKEREEKEEQRRKEREEKERKRLAEIEAKNEEKRKKNEAKEEEMRKKDDERRRKELEKEEVELKKKKAAQAFTKFFVAKAPSNSQQNVEEDENTGDGIKSLAFRPFQIKGDMILAPLYRKILTNEAKNSLEALIGCHKKAKDDAHKTDDDSDDQHVKKARPLPKSKLYLQELKSGKIIPGKWRRPSTETNDDIIIIEDELERVGQEIVEDTPAYIREEMRVKFYKFHDNRRPPYYGTFRKKSSIVSGRSPFVQDKKFFDYEVDSDDEWEEEEPGESLEDGSDDDKEKESDDDDYEVDNEWFVPHGHLSDEELQNEDEFGVGADNTREAQKAKLQIIQQEFAQEMKKKTEKIKPRLIGCIWADMKGNQPLECPRIIWETLGKRSMLYIDPPEMEEPKVEEPTSPATSIVESKVKPITISNEMVKDLVRLVHGNKYAKNFLIKEYIAFIGKTDESIKNGEFCIPSKAAVQKKIESIAEWQVLALTAINGETTNTASKKKKSKKRLCWVVHSDVLDKMGMSSLSLENTWEYTLTSSKGTKNDEATEPVTEINSKTDDDRIEHKTKSGTIQIINCTKDLTDEENAKKLENTSIGHPSGHTITETKSKADNQIKSPVVQSPAPKEKKRVPLLMSVGRGQQIPTPTKNKLISQFLQKGNKAKKSPMSPKTKASCSSSLVIDDDDIMILD